MDGWIDRRKFILEYKEWFAWIEAESRESLGPCLHTVMFRSLAFVEGVCVRYVRVCACYVFVLARAHLVAPYVP